MSVVIVKTDRYTVDPLYQWDLNQVLEIRGLSLQSVPEIHFTNEAMDRAIVRQASMDAADVITVEVPNSLLQKPYTIKAYVCIYEGESFRSLYLITVPVKARKRPTDYTFEGADGEIYSFNALENKVDNSVAILTQKCDDTIAEINNQYNMALRKIDEIKNELQANVNKAKTDLLSEINTNTDRIDENSVGIQNVETIIGNLADLTTTEKENIVKAINDVKSRILPNYMFMGMINNYCTDLNTLTTNGIYFGHSSLSVENKPTNMQYFSLLVMNYDYTRIQQVAFGTNDTDKPIVKIRTKYYNGTAAVWGDWKSLTVS